MKLLTKVYYFRHQEERFWDIVSKLLSGLLLVFAIFLSLPGQATMEQNLEVTFQDGSKFFIKEKLLLIMMFM